MPCQYIRLGLARQIKEIMKTIDDIWRLLNPQGEYKRRRGACERLWQGYSEARQEEIYAITIEDIEAEETGRAAAEEYDVSTS